MAVALRNKNRILVVIASGLVILLLMQACSGNRRGPREMDINQRFLRAESFREQGQCLDALPLYRPLAMRGRGFERSQLGLGLCLVSLAENEKMVDEGVLWMERAANAALPQAQVAMVDLYLFGPSDRRDKASAALWWVLYGNNRLKAEIGFIPLDEKQIRRIEAAFTSSELEDAAKRAVDWTPRFWTPPRASESDDPPQ